jgi:hypothetical protein
MAQLAQAFSGTYVQDANAANLLAGATISAAGTTNGTIVQVDRPGDIFAVLETGTVTGTSPTITVVVQGSDVSDFSSGVVEYGTVRIVTGAAAAQSNVRKHIDIIAYKKFVRANVTLGGTSPVYTGSTVKLQQEHFFQTKDMSAS